MAEGVHGKEEVEEGLLEGADPPMQAVEEVEAVAENETETEPEVAVLLPNPAMPTAALSNLMALPPPLPRQLVGAPNLMQCSHPTSPRKPQSLRRCPPSRPPLWAGVAA